MYLYEVGPNEKTIHVKKFQLLIRYGIERKAKEREDRGTEHNRN